MHDPAYDPRIATPALSDDELQALDDALQALPGDAVMNVEALDGYLCALLLGPPGLASLATSDWLPAVWGAAGGPGAAPWPAPFASGKQRKRVVQWVLRHLHDIDLRLRGDASRWEPVFSIAELDDGSTVLDAEDWCAGFLQAVPLAPQAWAAVFDAPEVQAALQPLVLLGSDEAGQPDAARQALADPAQRDALSRQVVDGVLALRGRRPQPETA